MNLSSIPPIRGNPVIAPEYEQPMEPVEIKLTVTNTDNIKLWDCLKEDL